MTGMVDAFQYVRGVYRTASQLLIASDALALDRGHKPFNWAGLLTDAQVVSSPNAWLHFHAQRHSRRDGNRHLSIAAMFYDPWDTAFHTPLCIATSYESTSSGNDLYWAGLALAWARGGHERGVVREVTLEDLRDNDDAFWSIEWPKAVPGGTARAVAMPLEEIRTVQDLEAGILEPLLGRP